MDPYCFRGVLGLQRSNVDRKDVFSWHYGYEPSAHSWCMFYSWRTPHDPGPVPFAHCDGARPSRYGICCNSCLSDSLSTRLGR
jgi:hypothetical protein